MNKFTDAFSGWDSSDDSGEDIFALADTQDEEKDSPKGKGDKADDADEDPKDPKDSGKDAEDEKEPEDLFAEADKEDNLDQTGGDENDKGPKGTDEGDEDDELSSSIAMLKRLKSLGMVDYELEEGQELTDDLANDFIEDGYEAALENKVKEKITSLPDDMKEALQYVMNGGNFHDYIESMVSDVELTEDMDLETEENQELVMRELLAEEDNDQDYIDTQIDFLKDSGKLANIAKKKYEKWNSERKVEKANLVAAQAKAKQDRIVASREAKRKFTDTLKDLEDVGGIPIDSKLKRDLPAYMKDHTVLLQNGSQITQMQKELHFEVLKNDLAQIQLAALLKNRNADGTFNFTDIATKVQTEITRNIKNDIQRNNKSKSQPKKKGGGLSLAEMLPR